MGFDVESYKSAQIDKIELDIETNTVEIEFYWPEYKTEKLRLVGLLSMRYRPDFTDEPPWICLNFSIELLNSIDELLQTEVLWKKGSNALNDLAFPIYRVNSGSGDYEFDVVCQAIEVHTVT